MHNTPTYSSWLNQVEIWFSKIERDVIRWLYPERHLAEAWGGAGQRIALFRDSKVVVVMTANDPGDYPRSPLAVPIYDVVRESVKSS